MKTNGTLPCYIAGEPVTGRRHREIKNPHSGDTVGSVAWVGQNEVRRAIASARSAFPEWNRWQRYHVLDRARQLLEQRQEAFAQLITGESGLCLRDTRYEVGRSLDILRFAAMETLRDDGQAFAGDVTPTGKARRILTHREPVSLAVAITPFNHPLNQVVHKVAPAIAAGAPMILKPSEKTPLTAIRFAELLYEAGLPGPMLSVLLGPVDEVVGPLVVAPEVEVLAFTGSVHVGRLLTRSAGYKRLILELGGNDPLIVCDDADLDLAALLAAEGAFRNSGQRCTAVKRILVFETVLAEFMERFKSAASGYPCGDPFDEATRVGTVIDESAAIRLETVVREAVADGAVIESGGERRGALLSPTVLSNVPRSARMVREESFGPLAPILVVNDLDDAIDLANATPYGLSSGVVTQSHATAMQCLKRLRCGAVNVNEVPGWRTEMSPFGGVGESGLGIKEGVQESIKNYSRTKNLSVPWL